MFHIVSIVLNGMPWIARHYDTFSKLEFPWRWVIVHGIADPVKDTSWVHGIPQGETVPDDGTLPYLLKLASEDVRVTVIHRDRWPGKTAMCNAALEVMTHDGTLLQLDADEFWTAEQLRVMPTLFQMFPQANAAQFNARIWVGPRRFCCIPGQWANRDYEWNRFWRFTSGDRFIAHEPPNLHANEAIMNRSITMAFGLVFDHYSYVLRSQVEWKAKYYSPRWSVEAWDRLQEMHGVVNLKEVLPFVDCDAISFETPA